MDDFAKLFATENPPIVPNAEASKQLTQELLSMSQQSRELLADLIIEKAVRVSLLSRNNPVPSEARAIAVKVFGRPRRQYDPLPDLDPESIVARVMGKEEQ